MQHGQILEDLNNLTEFSASDLMFAQMMIPHHEQAVKMAELAKTRAESSEVKALAEKILKEQAPEITLMTSWLTAAGQALQDHSMHMGSSGMLTDEELAKLETLKGKAFDTYFLESMIKHHQGAIAMAKDALSTNNPVVKTLLDNIIKAQEAEITQMRELLGN
jgi:uncharacterized protein (DUF305 family)